MILFFPGCFWSLWLYVNVYAFKEIDTYFSLHRLALPGKSLWHAQCSNVPEAQGSCDKHGTAQTQDSLWQEKQWDRSGAWGLLWLVWCYQKPQVDVTRVALGYARSLGWWGLPVIERYPEPRAPDVSLAMVWARYWVHHASLMPEAVQSHSLSRQAQRLSYKLPAQVWGLNIHPVLCFTVVDLMLGFKTKFCNHFLLFIPSGQYLSLCCAAWDCGRGGVGNVKLFFLPSSMHLFLFFCYCVTARYCYLSVGFLSSHADIFVSK